MDSASRELKILSDILALILDEQAGVATASLDAIRQRARQGGVSGGALKEAFIRAARGDDTRADLLRGEVARSRARIDELQSQVVAAEQMRRDGAAMSAALLRRSRLGALLTGLLAGAALAILTYGLLG